MSTEQDSLSSSSSSASAFNGDDQSSTIEKPTDINEPDGSSSHGGNEKSNNVEVQETPLIVPVAADHNKENAATMNSSPAATVREPPTPTGSTKSTSKTSKRKEGTSKTKHHHHQQQQHKEDKNIEHVLNALHNLKTPEERLAALCKKYTDLLEENRTSQTALKQSERRAVQLVKEKEQLQTDHSKAILATSRLEGLCRELQKQCKLIKDESILRVHEEEEKRVAVSTKFQTTLAEISTLMQENNQMNSVLREQNLELSQKLKTLVEQYELREQQVDKVVKHKDLELQLSEAKLAKSNMLLAEDKERHLREKQKLLGDLTECQHRCTDMASNEVQLRTQLAVYTEKYTEFQETLAKSNQVFVSFKAEMEKMSKKIKKLEKETGTWKSRWETSNRALLEMTEDRQKLDLNITNAQKKITQLEKLCRALQLENTSLRKQPQPIAPTTTTTNTTDPESDETINIQNGPNHASTEEILTLADPHHPELQNNTASS